MSDSAAPQPASFQADFRVGRVLSVSFSMLMKHLVQFFLIGVISAAPIVLWGIFLVSNANSLQSPEAAMAQLSSIGVVMVATLCIGAICQAVILYAAFQVMRGLPINLSEAIGVAIKRFIPLILVGICQWFILVVGMVLLVIPGVIFATMIAVAVPVCVVERLGPFASIGRSTNLTKGHRWKILGLYLAYFVIVLLVSIVVGAVAGVIGIPWLAVLTDAVIRAFTSAWLSLILVVTYHDLRAAKEGIGIDKIAAVFD